MFFLPMYTNRSGSSQMINEIKIKYMDKSMAFSNLCSP